MNLYKDLYKKANDSIPTDDAKMRVMAKLQKPAKVRRIRPVAEFAALAACLAVTFAFVGIYNNFEKEQNDNNLKMSGSVLTEPVKETQSVETKVADVTEKEVAQASTAPQRAAETKPDKAEKEPKVVTSATPRVSQEEVATSIAPETSQEGVTTGVAPKEPPEQTNVEVQTPHRANLIINEAKALSEAEVSTASLMMDRSVGRIEEITKDEYYQYIGKNIEADAVVPDGFELVTESTAMFEVADDGAYKNDVWCFVYQNEEKSVEIVTSKKADDVKEQLADEGYKKSQIKGDEAVVIKENDIYRAYMMPSDVGYSLTSFGLSEAELENLLVSLAE